MDMEGMVSEMQESDSHSQSSGMITEADSSYAQTAIISKTSADLEAVSQPDEDCAHCMMHSQNTPAISLRNAVQPRDSHQPAAAECAIQAIAPLPARTILDLHDHDPPGMRGARHLLINVFRI
jgi:hypothetical protein